jgi:hypothetical protein
MLFSGWFYSFFKLISFAYYCLFRAETLAAHIATESEEWLKFEMSRLNQCTRIFPLEPKDPSKAGTGEEEAEEKDEEEAGDADNEDGNQEQKGKKEGGNAGAKPKSASYEDIIFKVVSFYGVQIRMFINFFFFFDSLAVCGRQTSRISKIQTIAQSSET